MKVANWTLKSVNWEAKGFNQVMMACYQCDQFDLSVCMCTHVHTHKWGKPVWNKEGWMFKQIWETENHNPKTQICLLCQIVYKNILKSVSREGHKIFLDCIFILS